MRASIQGDYFEIAGGQLAQQKGSAQGVKDLGAKLVADHTTSLNDALALAQCLGLHVPDQPAPPQQWALHVLQTFTGAAFDQQYVALAQGLQPTVGMASPTTTPGT